MSASKTRPKKTKGKASQQQPAVDWSLKPRGPVSATYMGAAGTAIAAIAGDLANVSPFLAAAAGTAGLLGNVLVGAQRDMPPTPLGYRLACWSAASGWLTLALATNPWTANMMGGLAAGAVVAGVCSPLAKYKPRKARQTEIKARQAAEAAAAELVLAGGGHIGREWADRIKRVCRLDVHVHDVVDWPTGTGFDLHAQLPIGGTTVDDLARQAQALAADAQLPNGCGVEVVRGEHQGLAVLRVSTVNRLTQDIPFVPDHSPRSIADGVDLGEFHDGDPVLVMLRELSVLAVAMRGGGKTNLLDLFTYGVGLCTDTLVWHIDLNGGGMTWSWLKPWMEGKTDRPAVDWSAKTPEEAWLMVQIACAIGQARKGLYNDLKIEQNVRLMPISRNLPQILIVVDEGKTVLAPSATGIIGQIRDSLGKIQEEYRDAGVGLITTGLRAITTTIDSDFKAQVGIKIGGQVEKDAELSYLMDWGLGLSVNDLPTEGCFYIQVKSSKPRVFKARLMLPGHILQAALHIAHERTWLDEPSFLALRTLELPVYADNGMDVAYKLNGAEIYQSRHDRMRAAFATGPDQQQLPSGATSSAPTEPAMVPVGAAAPAGMPTPPAAPTASAAAAIPGEGNGPKLRLVTPDLADASTWPDPPSIANRNAQAGHGADGPAAGSPADPPQGQRPHPVPAATGTGEPGQQSTHGEHPLPQLVADVLAAFQGDTRAHSAVLGQRLRLTENQLAELLRRIEVGPLRHPIERGGKRARGYERADIERAAHRIRAGELQVPEEIANWPAATAAS